MHTPYEISNFKYELNNVEAGNTENSTFGSGRVTRGHLLTS